jgi:hypothetical protein
MRVAVIGAWGVFVCSVMGLKDAKAQSIFILNGSFEMPAIPAGTVKDTVDNGGILGWGTIPFKPNVPFSFSAGVANLPPDQYVPLSDGSQLGFVVGSGALTTEVGVTYAANNTS